MAFPQEALEDQLWIESAEIMLEQGHCRNVECDFCFIAHTTGHKTRICQDCFLDSMLSIGSFRVKTLAAKYIADHKGEEDEQK